MAEENKVQGIQNVSYRDLSDADFIRNLNYLSAYYYNDYFANMAHTKRYADWHIYDTSTQQCIVPYFPQPAPKKKEPQLISGYDKKRAGFLIGIMILSFLSFLVALSGLLRNMMPDWMALCGGEQKIYFQDFILSVTETLFSFGTSPYTQYLEMAGGWVRWLLCIGIVASVIYFVLSLLAFVLSIVALCGKSDKGWFKKIHFGWIGIVQLLCVGCMAVACFFSGYVNITARSFMLGLAIRPGYPMIALALFSLLTIVFSTLSYRFLSRIQ